MTDRRDHSNRFARVDDPLADTQDDAPGRDLADEIAECVAAEAVLTEELRILVEAMASVVGRTVAAVEHRVSAQRDHVPRRLAELESAIRELREWRLLVSGVADTNGRLGRIEERIPRTREDREAELAVIKGIRWTAAKVLAAIAVAATIAGGGIWQTIATREERARLAGESKQHEIEQDRRLDRCDPPRSTP